MNLKRWTTVVTCAIGVLMIASGCGRINLSSEASPTSPPTRTPRPTFTPRPLDTDTAVPTDTPQVTDTAVPTDTTVPPTRRPVVATARPRPTLIPQATAIPPTAGPTASPYQYLFYPLSCNPGDDPALCNIQNGGVKCSHSGQHWIDVYVASDYRDPSTVIAGIHVRYSFAPDGAKIDPDQVTGGDGKASKTLSGYADGPRNAGTYYAWVIDGSGNRISNMSPAIVINNNDANASNTCWAGQVAFAGGH